MNQMVKVLARDLAGAGPSGRGNPRQCRFPRCNEHSVLSQGHGRDPGTDDCES